MKILCFINREKHFENKKHNLIHSFMMATIASSTPAQNVALIQRMEIENMNLARERGFSGIFTTNTNELTRVSSQITQMTIMNLEYNFFIKL